jgi:hypothetical protein
VVRTSNSYGWVLAACAAVVAQAAPAALGLVPAIDGSQTVGCPKCDCCSCCETGTCTCTECTCECCVDECPTAGVKAKRAACCGA